MRLEGLGKLKRSNDLIGNGNRGLPACCIVPQPATLLSAKNTGSRKRVIFQLWGWEGI
jgi:hypothetical protein